jgi:hypothetical protein
LLMNRLSSSQEDARAGGNGDINTPAETARDKDFLASPRIACDMGRPSMLKIGERIQNTKNADILSQETGKFVN